MGERQNSALGVKFDRELRLEFHGSKITSDVGLLVYRELDETLGLTEMSAEFLYDLRTGKNTQHAMLAMLRQAIFGRLAGYDCT